jgi:hypothetical protein
MQKRSTVTNLMVVKHFIADCVDNRSQVDVVYLDFNKGCVDWIALVFPHT